MIVAFKLVIETFILAAITIGYNIKIMLFILFFLIIFVYIKS
jgi:hypothetical protein